MFSSFKGGGGGGEKGSKTIQDGGTGAASSKQEVEPAVKSYVNTNRENNRSRRVGIEKVEEKKKGGEEAETDDQQAERRASENKEHGEVQELVNGVPKEGEEKGDKDDASEKKGIITIEEIEEGKPTKEQETQEQKPKQRQKKNRFRAKKSKDSAGEEENPTKKETGNERAVSPPVSISGGSDIIKERHYLADKSSNTVIDYSRLIAASKVAGRSSQSNVASDSSAGGDHKPRHPQSAVEEKLAEKDEDGDDSGKKVDDGESSTSEEDESESRSQSGSESGSSEEEEADSQSHSSQSRSGSSSQSESQHDEPRPSSSPALFPTTTKTSHRAIPVPRRRPIPFHRRSSKFYEELSLNSKLDIARPERMGMTPTPPRTPMGSKRLRGLNLEGIQDVNETENGKLDVNGAKGLGKDKGKGKGKVKDREKEKNGKERKPSLLSSQRRPSFGQRKKSFQLVDAKKEDLINGGAAKKKGSDPDTRQKSISSSGSGKESERGNDEKKQESTPAAEKANGVAQEKEEARNEEERGRGPYRRMSMILVPGFIRNRKHSKTNSLPPPQGKDLLLSNPVSPSDSATKLKDSPLSDGALSKKQSKSAFSGAIDQANKSHDTRRRRTLISSRGKAYRLSKNLGDFEEMAKKRDQDTRPPQTIALPLTMTHLGLVNDEPQDISERDRERKRSIKKGKQKEVAKGGDGGGRNKQKREGRRSSSVREETAIQKKEKRSEEPKDSSSKVQKPELLAATTGTHEFLKPKNDDAAHNSSSDDSDLEIPKTVEEVMGRSRSFTLSSSRSRSGSRSRRRHKRGRTGSRSSSKHHSTNEPRHTSSENDSDDDAEVATAPSRSQSRSMSRSSHTHRRSSSKPNSVKSGRSTKSLPNQERGKSPVQDGGKTLEKIESPLWGSGDEGALKTGTSKSKTKKVRLGPVDRHYLNKVLVCMEMQGEWSKLSEIGTLTAYGHPWKPHPTGPKSAPEKSSGKGWFGGGKNVSDSNDSRYEELKRHAESPILKYLFWRLTYNFPGLSEAKLSYWQENWQPFFDSFAERHLSASGFERGEVTKRRMLSIGFTHLLGTYFSTCITATGDTKPSRPDAVLMKRLDDLFPGSMETMATVILGRGSKNQEPRYNAWVAVLNGDEEIEDFTIVTRVQTSRDKPYYIVARTYEDFEALYQELEKLNPNDRFSLPVLPKISSSSNLQFYLRSLVIALSSPAPSNSSSSDYSLARSRLEKFLLDDPEKMSTRDRERLVKEARTQDAKAEVARERWLKAGGKARRLRTTWTMWKQAIISGDELDRSFYQLKKHEQYKNLPPIYRDAQEWACIWVAYLLHFILSASPVANDLTHIFKRIHGLTPYGLMKQGLRLANPTFMIKFMVSLFFAQPAGQHCLFQRICGHVAHSDLKHRRKEITQLRTQLNDEPLANALERHAYKDEAEKEKIRSTAVDHNEDIVITVIKASDLPSKVVQEVSLWHEAWASSDMPPEKITQWTHSDQTDSAKFLLVKQLLRAFTIQRDREQALEVIMEQNTPHLLKATISTFYGAIYKIANASNLADRLGDLQAFIEDLLQLSSLEDPSLRQPSDYIRVCRKHDQSLWMLLHECKANGGNLMDPLIEWCRSGLDFIKSGIPNSEPPQRSASTSRRERSSLSEDHRSRKRYTRLGADLDSFLSNMPPDTGRQVVAEIRSVAFWTKYKKAYNDLRLRLDLLKVENLELRNLDEESLFAEIVDTDREMTQYKHQVKKAAVDTRGRTPLSLQHHPLVSFPRADQPNLWAWWIEGGGLGEGASIGRTVDWGAVEEESHGDSKKAGAAKLRRRQTDPSGSNPQGSKLSRDNTTGASRRDTAHRKIDTQQKDTGQAHALPPPPRMEMTRNLLEEYVKAVRPSLDKAKEEGIR